MNGLLQRLAALEPRVLLIILAAVAFLVGFESWVVLRTPWAELQALSQTRSRLQSSAVRSAGDAAELERLTRELGGRDNGLGGGLLRSDDTMLPFLITSLDAVAGRHGVALGGVKPPSKRPLGPFEEASFQVQANGRYPALFAWLGDVLKEVEPLVASDLEFKSIDESERVALSVRLSAYRVPGPAAAASGVSR